MKSFLDPRSVVLIGASRRSGTGAYNNLEMMRRYGYAGPIHVVHPAVPEILGQKTLPSVAQLPEVPDLAVISVGRESVLEVVTQCVAHGIKHVIIISQGFADADERGRQLQREITAVAKRAGARVLGPNTMGSLNASSGFSTAFLDLPKPANPPPLALVAQSGVFQVGPREFIGELGKAIDVGNSCDVDCVDGLQLFEDDPEIEVIALYLEGITRGREFLETAARVARKKPLVVLKAGRSSAGAQAVISHTGTLAGEDAVFDAVLKRAGAVRVPNILALRAACRAFLHFRPMQGPRLAIVSCTGAAGIIGADACEDHGLQLAPFPERLQEELQIPRLAWYQLYNPADIWPPAMASGEYIAYMKRSVRGFLHSDDVDGLLGVLVSMDSPLHSDHDLIAAARDMSADNIERKPVALWLYGSGAQRQSAAINAERLPGVACFGDLDSAMMGLSATWRHSELSRRRPPDDQTPGRPRATLPDGKLILGEVAENFLRGYGLSFAPGGVAADAAQAVALAERIGYPVVLKIISPDWVHKTDGGGVLLGIRERSAVEAGFMALQELFSARTPGASLQVIQVQKQMQGVELLLGIKRDPQFGPVIAAGMGGIYTEILKDVILEPAPLSRDDPERMLSGLRMAPLLEGARGTGIRRDAVVQALFCLSTIAMNHEEIAELDLNPVLVNAHGCYCVDARIIRHL